MSRAWFVAVAAAATATAPLRAAAHQGLVPRLPPQTEDPILMPSGPLGDGPDAAALPTGRLVRREARVGLGALQAAPVVSPEGVLDGASAGAGAGAAGYAFDTAGADWAPPSAAGPPSGSEPTLQDLSAARDELEDALLGADAHDLPAAKDPPTPSQAAVQVRDWHRAPEPREARDGDKDRSSALPDGWESAVDPTTGRTYYFNRAKGISEWKPPDGATGDSASGSKDMPAPPSRAFVSSTTTTTTSTTKSPAPAPTPSDGSSPLTVKSSVAAGATPPWVAASASSATPPVPPSGPQPASPSVTNASNTLVMSDSDLIKLVESNKDCMTQSPPEVCIKQFGTFGVRRLRAMSYQDITYMGFQRPSWMAHDAVQSRRLLDVSFPATYGSASYTFKNTTGVTPGTVAAWGVQTQYLDLEQQLQLGVRAFDFKVCTDYEDNNLIYACNGMLNAPLGSLLDQLDKFLRTYTKEVVVIRAGVGQARRDLNSPAPDPMYSQYLIAEKRDLTRVPGQSVHEEMQKHLGDFIVTYSSLTKLSSNETIQNPLISSLVGLGGRVVYFWEGQQVLCLNLKECRTTPMYTDSGLAVARDFGFVYAPMPMDLRPLVGAYRNVEPLCLAESTGFTRSTQPGELVKNLKSWAFALPSSLNLSSPTCFPIGGGTPAFHGPPVFFWADGAITSSSQAPVSANFNMSQKKMPSMGEDTTISTVAEHVNYLILAWYMKAGANQMFSAPNALAVEFIHPIIVQRLVEAMQGQPDCGDVASCNDTGSCTAISLLQPDGSCMREEDGIALLSGERYVTAAIAAISGLIGICGIYAMYSTAKSMGVFGEVDEIGPPPPGTLAAARTSGAGLQASGQPTTGTAAAAPQAAPTPAASAAAADDDYM